MQPNTSSVELIIETIPDGKGYILKAPAVSTLTKFFLGMLTLTCFFYVLSILLRAEVSEGAIIGAIVVTLILLFITRLFLWNTFGREVFEVTSDAFRHYNDYRFFQDELVKVEGIGNARFSYQSVAEPSSEYSILDEQERILSNEYYLVIEQDGKELSRSHLALDAAQIKRIFGDGL